MPDSFQFQIGAKAYELAKQLLFNKEKPFSIGCELPKNFIGGEEGFAPLPSESGYPSIYVNAQNAEKNGKEDLSSVVWHEFVHTLGHSHGSDVEYPYSCQWCCFPKKNPALSKRGNERSRSAACEICRGTFDDITDSAYLATLIAAIQQFPPAQRIFYIVTYLLREPLLKKNGVLVASYFADSLISTDAEPMTFEIVDEFEKRKVFEKQTQKKKDILSPILSRLKKYRKSKKYSLNIPSFKVAYEPLLPEAKKIALVLSDYIEGEWTIASDNLQKTEWPDVPKTIADKPEAKYFSLQKEATLRTAIWILKAVSYQCAAEIQNRKSKDGKLTKEGEQLFTDHFEPLQKLKTKWETLLANQQRVSDGYK